VVARRSAPAVAVHPVRAAPPQDRTVAAKDIALLEKPELATIDRDGLRVIDVELAQRLGLAPGERVTAISGRTLKRDLDLREMIRATAAMNVNTLYVELERGDDTALVRWRVDGTLAIARSGIGSPPILPVPPPPGDPVVPVLAGLTKLDDDHFTVTRAAFDAFLADRDRVLRGARIVPAVRLGQADGYRLYAIRPTSLFAHLGLQNGDTLRELNGVAVIDRGVLDDVRDTTQFLFKLDRRGNPFELTITVK